MGLRLEMKQIWPLQIFRYLLKPNGNAGGGGPYVSR